MYSRDEELFVVRASFDAKLEKLKYLLVLVLSSSSSSSSSINSTVDKVSSSDHAG